MRWILLAVSGLCLTAWIVMGSIDRPFGQPLPPLGDLYHPTRGLWQNALPEYTHPLQGKIQLDHPLARGDVFYDERDIPHIFADSVPQLLFLQGYLTARDRLWQMDISTRSTGGELAEVLGENLIARDRRQIRHGFRAAAELAVTTWKENFPADYAMLEAYCAGINAYIDQLQPHDYPVEYKLLGFQPRKWTPYHTALMLKGMTQSMTDRNNDAAYSKALEELGLKTFQSLYPSWNRQETPIVPSGTAFDFPQAEARKRSPLPVLANEVARNTTGASGGLSLNPPKRPSEAGFLAPNDYDPANGSNNWAVAGSKSLTGRPILAGDPHLNLTLPSIWYEIQLSTPGADVRGVSLPGLPFVVIGFNNNIAWSMTNGQEDVVDYYRMDWTDSTRMAYRIGGEVYPVLLRQDTLKIKGAEPTIVTTRWTQRGPVAVEDPDSPYDGLAKDAIYLYTQTDRPFAEVSVVEKFMRARNLQDFEAASQGYSEPIMNFAYADKHGDIAMLVNGFMPLRRQDSLSTLNGLTISDGSRPKPNWTSYVPFEHMPRQINPRRGFVSSANQRPTDDSYPYLYYGAFIDWRGRYINRELARAKRLDYQDMQALQQDAHSMMAEQLLPLLLARINRGQLTEQGLRWFTALAEWDYAYTRNSKAASFFERWRNRTYQLTTDEINRDDGYPGLLSWRWIELLRYQPDHPIFDIQATDTRETAAMLTQRAFDELLEKEEEAPIPNWEVERNGALKHLGLIPGFGSGLLKTNGHNSAPNATMRGHGPSWRMVVELGEKVHAYGLLPGGASGNPASPNFTGGVEEWSRGRYFDLSFWTSVEQASRKAQATLTFE